MSKAAQDKNMAVQLLEMIENLKSDNKEKRLESARQLQNIASALGPDRSRMELLPYIRQLLDDEEEVLVIIVQQLGKMLDQVGGPTYAFDLLKVLECFCAVDEMSTREAATESMKQILQSVRLKDQEVDIMNLIERLHTSGNSTTKYSAVNLIPFVYTYCSV